jgi:SAM-dependent methyltransferase
VEFADHFSRQAREYTQFRPRYPRALFEYLASLVERRETAWDCGTGNGQAAVELAELFDRVVATDPSENQLRYALPHAKVEYRLAAAESCPLQALSVDLVTVAQAIHWFDRERFYGQVRRVGRAGSILAAWCYPLATITGPVDHVVRRLYADIVGPYWPPERGLIMERYATIDFPFEEIRAPEFEMTAEWTLGDLLGYLKTWSSVQKYIERHGDDPLEQVDAELAAAWGPADRVCPVRWPLYMRVGRIAGAAESPWHADIRG